MQSISPETIYRGNYAWEESLPQITKLTKRLFSYCINREDIENAILQGP